MNTTENWVGLEDAAKHFGVKRYRAHMDKEN